MIILLTVAVFLFAVPLIEKGNLWKKRRASTIAFMMIELLALGVAGNYYYKELIVDGTSITSSIILLDLGFLILAISIGFFKLLSLADKEIQSTYNKKN